MKHKYSLVEGLNSPSSFLQCKHPPCMRLRKVSQASRQVTLMNAGPVNRAIANRTMAKVVGCSPESHHLRV